VAVNLRDKPIDRRRLSRADRQSYRPGQRTQKVARARARKGYIAQRENMPVNTTDRRAGTGGFTQGLAIQQQRVRDKGQELKRSKQLRPTADMSMYDIYQ
jgi:hypothetical protein